MAGVAGVVLTLTATAWACTAQIHNMAVVTSSFTRTGPAGTPVVASGFCYDPGCPRSFTVSLRQDATSSTGNKNVSDHQVLCRAEGALADPIIGSVTFDASGAISSGSGTIAARQAPGPYIVCAGDTDAVAEIMWDVFTLS